MSRLVAAIQLATAAHAGQLDKVGQPFIGHPLRVMARGTTESEMVVGVLHDVIEDTNVLMDDLYFATRDDAWLLTNEEAHAVRALTRMNTQTYKQYIAQLVDYPLAVAVKRYDLLDNADPMRGWAGTPISRYRWAWTYLFPNEPLPRELEKST